MIFFSLFLGLFGFQTAFAADDCTVNRTELVVSFQCQDLALTIVSAPDLELVLVQLPNERHLEFYNGAKKFISLSPATSPIDDKDKLLLDSLVRDMDLVSELKGDTMRAIHEVLFNGHADSVLGGEIPWPVDGGDSDDDEETE